MRATTPASVETTPRDGFPRRRIATGWGNLTQVFSAGEGIIYTITPDGKLWWFKHTGFINGKATWEGPKNVGRGWKSFKHVF